MESAIKLDGEPTMWTIEVQHEGSDRMLTAELQT